MVCTVHGELDAWTDVVLGARGNECGKGAACPGVVSTMRQALAWAPDVEATPEPEHESGTGACDPDAACHGCAAAFAEPDGERSEERAEQYASRLAAGLEPWP